ncbi:PREDICTED: hydrolethalus syndrome protein 1 [Sturnus vulgaris]|uniref:hydrolethalus syndrome protein 1 n=1 Tax=Sturnus vulgaris TaxID=9172 RepID=UPI00071A56B1|nr:PREDICTED: hydrolethalus syndrome protein 1 [Sturnus vulgaris]
MEKLLGAESEEELAAYLSQLHTWQEGGKGPWCSYHDPYADSSIIFDTWPSLPMDQNGSRRSVMKRKVLRHRPDGTVEVSDESPNAKPWSRGHSRASVGDPISKIETTLENNLHYDDGNKLREDSLCSLLRDFGNNTASNYAMLRQQARNYIAPKAQKVKRTDPVAKLNKYKQDWKRFSFPGQDPHESLRRAVHRQILQTGLPRRAQKRVSVPNPYEVPTMKKRDSLRFGVRWDLAHRRIPRRNTTC